MNKLFPVNYRSVKMAHASAVVALGLHVCLCLNTFPCFARPPLQSRNARPPANHDLDAVERLIDAGRVGEAREKLIRLFTEQKHSPRALYLEAKILFRERRFVESAAWLEKILRARDFPPELESEIYKLWAMNYILLDRLDLAEPILRAAAQSAPNDHHVRYHLGMLSYTTSRFAAAEKELRETIRLRPDFVKGHEGLGLALEELNQAEEALRCHRRAVELGEQQRLADSSPHLNLGKFLLTKNRFQESLRPLSRAAELSPQSAEVFYYYGKALFKAGRSAPAVTALVQSTRNDPDYAESHYLLSRIYLSQGRAEEAQRELRLFQERKKTSAKKSADAARP